MTREETKKVLKILSTAYPRYFADMSIDDKKDQIGLYVDMFGQYDVRIVVTALKNYIKDNEYPPSIAGLQKQIDKLMPVNDSAAELWNILSNACKRGSVFSEKDFAMLPPAIQKWCGNVATIKELSMMDSKTFNTVTRGQFLKSVETITEREKAQGQLPDTVKNLLEAKND